MDFDKGDVVYYKVMIKKILEEAKENNVEVSVEDIFGLKHIMFRNDLEVAGCAILENKKSTNLSND